MKKTVVIGVSENPERTSNLVVRRLVEKNIPVVAIGLKKGIIGTVVIQTGFPEVQDADTVTLYIRSQHQLAYYDYIFQLKPKRIIFNPGAENQALFKMAESKGIETLNSCTLTLLAVGNY